MSVRPDSLEATAVGGTSGVRATEPRTTAHTPLEALLRQCVEHGASDLLLVAGVVPAVLVNGQWKRLQHPAPSPDELLDWFRSRLSADQFTKLQVQRDLDLGMAVANLGRFRINIHYQRGVPAAAIRAIPSQVPQFDTLNLPSQVLSFAEFSSGLVLVTGGTGQGKSTTLASMINHINQTRSEHIITIEDPLEFDFSNEKSIIEQRQIGDDSPSFASALRHVLRQRPDVILIGEMRDLETISTALTAAETGHLVFATLHTSSAVHTVARIIDVFPPTQQAQVRTQLAASLRAIVCQNLLEDQLNNSLVPATEVMIATSAIRRNIRENDTHLVYSSIETGRRLGMHTMEQSLLALEQSARITPEAAIAAAGDSARMRTMLGIGGD